MATRSVVGVVGALVATAALGLTASLVSGADAHVGRAAAAGAANFSDPAGDAQGAADLTAVAVSDDLATGSVRIAVTAAGILAIDPAVTPELNIFLDSDRNGVWDRAIAVYRSNSVWWNNFYQSADGVSLVQVEPSATMSWSRSGETFTWQLGRSDLAGSSGFNFRVRSVMFDASMRNIGGSDSAPDSGTWSYDLPTPLPPATTVTTTTTESVSVKPVIGVPTTTPAKAIAGRRFAVSFPVSRSDTGEPLTSGTMVCNPSVQGKLIAHTESFKNGSARLAFMIPKNAKGKLLKIKVTIQLGSKSTTRLATFHVS